jgi:dipeptidase D
MCRPLCVSCCCILVAVLAAGGCTATNKAMSPRGCEMAATEITLKNAQAQRVWEIFRDISRVPRCSKNKQPIIEWLKRFAQSHSFTCRSDAVGNTVIELPATIGCEDEPAVVLQSHVDMVCEKTPDSEHDFSKDPIEIIERDGWVCADGTTLGADNGLGMSLALALTEEKTPHPRLELLFTVDEETGLSGASALQPGFITAKFLINLDGEDESFIVGCAGGELTDITLKLDWLDAPADFDCFTLKVSGLQGGHSGIDIDKNRANAIKILSRAIRDLQGRSVLHICSVDGGKAANAIPRDAHAVVRLDPSSLGLARQTIADLESSLKKEFSETDPAIKIELARSDDCGGQVWSSQCTKKVIGLLSGLLAGVYRLSGDFKGIVETSNNLARVKTIRGESILGITTMQRSFDVSCLDELTAKITAIASSAGAKVVTSGRYPSWKPDTDSSLLKQAKEVYRQLRKKPPAVKVVHAGLECAIIGEKFPDIEMISVGPTIENPHSPQERVNIASVDNAWEFLAAFLPSLTHPLPRSSSGFPP